MENLYQNLMNLCTDTKYEDAFFFKDFTLDDKVYRIFNYRLVGWTTFQEAPDSKKCRGTMFEISGDQPLLVSLPPDKFFNYAEGGVDHSKFAGTLIVNEKLDGSLISTYMHNGQLRLKSKGSISSAQALDAMAWLDLPENAEMKSIIIDLAVNKNCTVNMEWTGPQNRIVVGYEKPELRVISLIQNMNGFVMLNWITTKLPFAKQINIEDYMSDLENKDITSMVNKMYNETTGEGYVISFMKEGVEYQVKVKNHTYCNLHKIKDSISNPEALAELIIRGEVDDVYELFADDPITLNVIEDMENKIVPIFNHMVAMTESFYFGNRDLTRKEYAIKAKHQLEMLMPLLMNLYIEREISYEDFAIRNLYKIFGVKNVQKNNS